MSNLAIFNKTINDQRTQSYLNDVLKDKKESFVTTLVSVVANNTMLQQCEPLTIMYAAMKATALSLPIDPNLGFAYVIPYKNHGKDEAQFQIGFKGILQLAMRSGQFKTINTDAVYEGELSGTNRMTGEIELNGKRKSDKVVGYFAYMCLTNGFEKTIFMSKEDVEKHGKRFSKAYSSGPWSTDFDAMAKKTILKKLLSQYAPMSIEMQSAIKADQAIYRDETMTEDYADNPQTKEQSMTEAQVDKIREKAEKVRARAKSSIKPEAVVEETPASNDVNADFNEMTDEEDDLPEGGKLL